MDTRDKGSELAPAENMAPQTGTAAPPLDLLEAGGDITAAAASLSIKNAPKASSPFRDSLKRLTRDKRAMISLWVLIFFIVLAIVGPYIYHVIGSTYNSDLTGEPIGPSVYHTFAHQEVTHADENPSARYWMGTDGLGRDMLARMFQGLNVSIVIAFLVEVVDILLGITIGVLAGYYGGWIDQLLARFTDLMFAFPSLLFIILLVGLFGPQADQWFGNIPFIKDTGSARLVIGSAAIAFTVWPLMARYVRGQTLQLKEQQFIEAARTSGSSNTQIILRHIIPNLFSLVFIASTLNVSNTIIGEAGISLLGLGVVSPGSSIGLMISDGLEVATIHPWEVLFPTIILTIIVLCISFLGDGLRDAFDPRSKD
ncbi:ABC transporter permease [Tengunoibacter tsumagoiensis]|uniref:Peptide ABC transporter permease n=1 Tax=Tengunoibacter tsumagoiensis TaxID=2014871 RepID=A0A402A1P7_9CHLR|nr:ABC transporter permease [Tengunoibacter tsumagoiensis]GCE13080.1 peptide ABC transporter permease [Tengunoibacter tsumagoiensis]